MIKIEAITLEEAYEEAAKALECSITQLKIEVVQVPSKGVFGFFQKKAIIVAVADVKAELQKEKAVETKTTTSKNLEHKEVTQEDQESHNIINDTIMPVSFVSDQDDEEDDLGSGLEYTADYDDAFDESDEESSSIDIDSIAIEVQEQINKLFASTCFNIETIDVRAFDNETLLIEFKGDDAALLIGKEGYRYKALSYMIFNWINSKYEVQLRLEIAEFLKNQEESVGRYLSNVYENIERDGRAQTKILDGILVQIALKELRNRYPEKYVVIRSTKDGLKYIIVNDYHSN